MILDDEMEIEVEEPSEVEIATLDALRQITVTLSAIRSELGKDTDDPMPGHMQSMCACVEQMCASVERMCAVMNRPAPQPVSWYVDLKKDSAGRVSGMTFVPGV